MGGLLSNEVLKKIWAEELFGIIFIFLSNLFASGQRLIGQTTPQKPVVVLLTALRNVESCSQMVALRLGRSTVKADALLLVIASMSIFMLRWDIGGTGASAC